MNSWDADYYFDMSPGKHEIQIKIPNLGLGLGLYTINIAIRMEKLFLLEKIDSFKFAIKKNPSHTSPSMFSLPHTWEHISK